MGSYQRQRAWREAHPESVKQERRRNAARQRALVQLSRAYPEQFKTLYVAELVTAGLPVTRGAHIDG